MAIPVLLLSEGSSTCTTWRAIDLTNGWEATSPEANSCLSRLATLVAGGGTPPAVPTLYNSLYAQVTTRTAIPLSEFFSGSVAMTVAVFGAGGSGGGGSGGGDATAAKQDQQTTLLTSLHNDQATAVGQAAQLTELDNIDLNTLATTISLGTDGTSPPTLPGGSTGVRGWLRYLASLFTFTSNGLKVDGSAVTQPVSGTVAVSGTVPVTGTVGISGTVPISGTVGVSGTVAVSAAALPLPTGAATAANQATANASLSSIDGKLPALVAARIPVDGSGVTQPVSGTVAVSGTVPISAAALPLPTGAATETTLVANGVLLGAVNETAPASDTASAGHSGRLQRIAQRVTTLIGLFPAALGQTTKSGALSVTVASDQGSQDVDQTSTATLSAVNANPTSGTPTANSTCTLTINPGLAVAAFHVSAGAIAGNAQFQGTVNGTTWKLISGFVFNNGGAAANSTISLTVDTIYFLPVGGLTQVRLSVTAISSGSAAVTARGSVAPVGVAIPLSSTLFNLGLASGAASTDVGPPGAQTLRVALAQPKNTFSSSFQVAPAALATDIVMLASNSSLDLYITRIRISPKQTTAGQVEFHLIRRSTLDSGGASTTGTAVRHSMVGASANSAPTIFTANPSLGATTGTIRREEVFVPAAATLGLSGIEWNFGAVGQPLHCAIGGTDAICINLNGVTMTGGLIDIEIEWQEY